MRLRYVALVFAVLLPSLAAAQRPLCRLCVERADDWPRPYRNADPASAGLDVTTLDLLQLGLVTRPDMRAQLPSNIPLVRQGIFLDETLARQRAERLASETLPAPPLVHETILAAPPESVWRAWTTSAGLASWLAPRAEVDLRIGGKLRVAYDAAAGGLYGAAAVENEILAYDAPRMLAYRVSRAPADFPRVAAVASMWTVVYLDAASADTTRVRVVVNGLSDADARAFFESDNAETLRRLEERFGTPQ